MVGEWREATLGDGPLEILDGDRGKNYPKQEDFALSSHCLFLNAGNVTTSGFNFSNCSFISAEKDAALHKGKLRRHDIVLTTRGTVGNVAYFDDSIQYEHIRINSGMVIFRTRDQELYPRYLYMFLRSSMFRAQVESLRTGSAQPQLPIRDINRVEIPIPPFKEQQAIANILGTLDDKIELNRRMNRTLEAMAQSIFKSWFENFDPVRAKSEGRDPGLPKPLADLFPDSFEDSELGEIPKRWCVASIGEVVEVIDCLHSKKPDRQKEGLPLLQLSNIRDDGLIDMQDMYFIDEADYRTWISRMEASHGDCVITNVGRVGAVAQMPVGKKAALGRNMTGLRCKAPFSFPTFLIECLLSQAMRDEIVLNMDTGTILDALNVRNIPKLRFARSPDTILQCYEEVARSLRARMEQSLFESRTLAALRDTLLPELISGEVRVKDAERFIGRCL